MGTAEPTLREVTREAKNKIWIIQHQVNGILCKVYKTSLPLNTLDACENYMEKEEDISLLEARSRHIYTKAKLKGNLPVLNKIPPQY